MQSHPLSISFQFFSIHIHTLWRRLESTVPSILDQSSPHPGHKREVAKELAEGAHHAISSDGSASTS